MSEAEPRPEDNVSSALAVLFPGRSAGELEPAAKWLGEQFGVEEYADLEGATIWAEAALGILAGDSSLDSGARAVLEELLARYASGGGGAMGGAAAVEPAAEVEPGPPGAGAGGPRLEDFLVVGRLGAGTFAAVHRAEERASRRSFALKEIKSSYWKDEAFHEQITREVDIHKSLDHPNILRCWESFDASDTIFLVLELADSGDLYHHMHEAKLLQETEAARLFSEVASGVHYLHVQEVMHRDLKPENILLHGTGRHAKIADFGWCARASEKQTGECGSPAYFAPEMVDGLKYDGRVDVWALGILLYEMLVGHSPFSSALTEKETRQRISRLDFGLGAWSSVPATAQPLIRALLRREPEERTPLREVLADAWLVPYTGSAAHEAAMALEGRR